MHKTELNTTSKQPVLYFIFARTWNSAKFIAHILDVLPSEASNVGAQAVANEVGVLVCHTVLVVCCLQKIRNAPASYTCVHHGLIVHCNKGISPPNNLKIIWFIDTVKDRVHNRVISLCALGPINNYNNVVALKQKICVYCLIFKFIVHMA